MTSAPRRSRPGRLLDHYRQFEGLSEQEINAGKHAEAKERRRRALARVEAVDLSQTTWPTLPHPHVVNAVTFAARRGLHRYPPMGSDELRHELAARHDMPPARVVVGNGAAQLLSAAAHVLLAPERELITPWPSYPLYPLMARRARGHPVPVREDGLDAVLAAVNERTRVVALANPNDPTGRLRPVGELRELLSALPDDVVVLLDEALIDFADAQPVDASLALLDDHPRLLVFRSFSKAWGLAGLRCGYVLGGPGSEELLAALAPDLGMSELVTAGVRESLRAGGPLLERRLAALRVERATLTAELRARELRVPDSQANFLWVAHRELDGASLAERVGRAGVMVAGGAAIDAPGHVRVTVRDRAASERLLEALDGLER